MVFSSLLFIFLFLPVVLSAYYLAPRCLRNAILVLSSLIFYAWGEPIYVLLMIFVALFDYGCALLLDRYAEQRAIRCTVLWTGISVNLLALGFFKYVGFVISNLNGLFHLQLGVPDLPLPIGISFYTFQSISYILDVYWGRVQAQRNIIAYATFITLFPQLLAGPIIKYIDVAKQIENRRESMALFGEGAMLFIIGLSKKVLLANNIGLIWQQVKATPLEEVSMLTAWLGILAFTFQIYFDFSGYSDMARGLCKMFGFNIMQNFNYPYIAQSITEFWRRWHISLGSWFREYLYIPLGGNRVNKLKWYRNLFIVWFLTGFWHGASWNFIFWGLYFGLFVTLEKVLLLNWMANKPRALAHGYTLFIVVVGWVFFEFTNLTEGFHYLQVMFGFTASPWVDGTALFYLYTYALFWVILVLCATPLPQRWLAHCQGKAKLFNGVALTVMYSLLLFFCTAYLVNLSYNPFLYFRF